MRPYALSLVTVIGAALAGSPADLAAQYRLDLGSELLWPAPWSARPELAVAGTDQVQRLPVYDEAGGLISFEAIQERVDRSGLKGAFWGGLVGFVGGSLVGLAFTPMDCNRQEAGYYIPCSPREEALKSAWPLGLSLVGLVAGAWLGSSEDLTTWQEALADIRAERRLGVIR